MGELFYADISEKFPCLSRAELVSLLEKEKSFREVYHFTGLALFELESRESLVLAQRRSSTIRSVGAVSIALDALGRIWHLKCVESFGDIRVKRVQGMNRKMKREDAARAVEKLLNERCGAERRSSAEPIDVYMSEGVIIAGTPISSEGKGDVMGRNPHNLPFYKPGALNPWYARLLVNLASPGHGEKLYDPFCGTATIPLAASEVWTGLELLCSDIRRDMCAGARRNLEELSGAPFEVFRADASLIPARGGAFDFVVSDPPYDRSVRSLYSEAADLLSKTLFQLSNLLKSGGRVVASVDEQIARRLSIPSEFEQKFRCPMYVHNRLTRTILVLVRK